MEAHPIQVGEMLSGKVPPSGTISLEVPPLSPKARGKVTLRFYDQLECIGTLAYFLQGKSSVPYIMDIPVSADHIGMGFVATIGPWGDTPNVGD